MSSVGGGGGGGSMSARSLSGGGGGGGEKSAVISVIVSLEKEKMRLLDQIERDRKTVEDLKNETRELRGHILTQRTKLGSYNSLFMRLPDAAARAPRQRLGAREAVLGTKRIIQRELERLESEVVVAEMKLNRSREKNQAIREKINSLRREHATYRHIFARMQEELTAMKTRIKDTDNAIDDGYLQRDRAQEEMRELTKQFELDKVERTQEYKLVTEQLEQVQASLAQLFGPPGAGGGSGSAGAPGSSSAAGKGGTASDESDSVRRRISKLHERLVREKHATEMAERKKMAFAAALQRVQAGTGLANPLDVVNTFNRYEEEKFMNAGLVQQLMSDTERLERAVSSVHEELTGREEENSKVKVQRAGALEQLQATVEQNESEADNAMFAAVQTVREVKSLYRIIEFAFRALGIHSDLTHTDAAASPASPSSLMASASGFVRPLSAGDRPSSSPFTVSASPISPGMDAPSPCASPTDPRMRGGSLNMYAHDARTRHAVKTGVSASTLAAFIGTIENRSSDVVQQYAAFITKLGALATGGAPAADSILDFAAQSNLVSTMRARLEDEDAKDETLAEEGGVDAAGPAAQALYARRAFHTFAASSPDMARQLQLPSVLGPANPHGRVKEAIATSVLMASLAVDSAHITGEEAATGEDEARPLSLLELKFQAAKKLTADKNIRALKTAASAAASVLVTAGQSPSAKTAGAHGAGAAAASSSSLLPLRVKK